MPGPTRLVRALRAPLSSQLLAAEAFAELTLARINTLFPAKHFTRLMGALEGTPIQANPEQQAQAQRIGHIVTLTAGAMPFRVVCLQQVLAVRRMLHRRHIPSTIYLGVLKNDPLWDRQGSRSTMSIDGSESGAHAWVKSGELVVNGKTVNIDEYVILGIFS